MKYTALVLALLLALATGFTFGRAQGVQVVQGVLANHCDNLGGFAVGNKVYTCARQKKSN